MQAEPEDGSYSLLLGGILYYYSQTKDETMTEEITRDLFDKLVELAALELQEDEAEYIRRQLNDQLTAIRELAAVPLEEGTPPAAHGVAYTDATSAPPRQDQHNPDKNADEILAGAPEEHERYIVTPDIPHEDLG